MNVPPLYIPSQVTVASPYSTDDYVTPTEHLYHLQTDRLITVGNPYFQIADADHPGVIAVPKVSANQYRCFRLQLPDPNGPFPLPSNNLYDPEKHRLVWQLVGLEIDRGQPLGVGLVAAPAFNRGRDAEANSRAAWADPEGDNRISCAFEPKHNQMLIVGCAPAVGQHWGLGTKCPNETPDTKCPPIELVNSNIQDGDMSDIGFGAMDFNALGLNRSDVPMELAASVAKYPDWIKMHTDAHGDSCFYYVTREQIYARRYWQQSGVPGEPVPETVPIASREQIEKNNSAYMACPSGSVITSDTNLFNRPYWLSRAQGTNNGILWNENLFVTVLDNSRNVIMKISSLAEGAQENNATVYDWKNYYECVRHVEEYGISAIVRLCRVTLTAENLGSIYRMNPDILKKWGIQEAPLGPQSAEDKYRFTSSQAITCQLPQNPPNNAPDDPYKTENYWTVDCRERLSDDLLRYPLGRKFLQLPRTSVSTRRAIGAGSATTGNTKSSTRKRKRNV
ncbi:putative major capsid protein L1 [Etapapillomavirus 1]|uniref:Major capsid protein L1 n=34 Tax=Etapapillomavirus TaxID=325458 RepID=Q8JNA2_FCPVN|nr:putative major capsid protein L1 [Etapapillomavirus 1]AAL14231.1 putative major capsid protein L1 [Etapapillomavirus 1]ANN44257.1 L1 [Etapapillomavirus 1]